MGASLSLAYRHNGNIQSKTGVGTYTYGSDGNCNAGPHAVRQAPGAGNTTTYCYDAHGNQLSSRDSSLTAADGRNIHYTPFQLPDQILSVRGAHNDRVDFTYGPGRERLTRLDYASSVAPGPNEITHFIGGGVEAHLHDSRIELRRHLGSLVLLQTAAGLKREYHWTDHLGSVIAVTDVSGEFKAGGKLGFDPFGARRDATTGSSFSILGQLDFNTATTTRHGYTGHEQIDEGGLIHMNGRIYDPTIARFVQADSIIQDPYESQSLNRYSYVMNNPLNATDPSGNIMESNASTFGFGLNSVGSLFRQTAANHTAFVNQLSRPVAGEAAAVYMGFTPVSVGAFTPNGLQYTLGAMDLSAITVPTWRNAAVESLARSRWNLPDPEWPLIATGAMRYDNWLIVDRRMHDMQARADANFAFGLQNSYYPIGTYGESAGFGIVSSLPPVAYLRAIKTIYEREEGWEWGIAEAALAVTPLAAESWLARETTRAAARSSRFDAISGPLLSPFDINFSQRTVASNIMEYLSAMKSPEFVAYRSK